MRQFTSIYLNQKDTLAANFEAMARRLNEGDFTEQQLRVIKLKQDEFWRIPGLCKRTVSR